MKIPIVDRYQPSALSSELEKARSLAKKIMKRRPELNWREGHFSKLVVDHEISDEPTLHLDDFSEIPVLGAKDNSAILQQRARLRAASGDWVAQSRIPDSGFSDYCEYQLGLGRVHWLHPAIANSDPRQIALECLRDRRLRHDLEQAVRREGLRYIHPHISTHNVWELAAILQKSTRMPLSVIGPTPALASWANDKVEFTWAAKTLLGDAYVPHTETAYNFAALSKTIFRVAQTHQKMCIKFPYGTGGNGNFLVDADDIKGLSLKAIRTWLKRLLGKVHWPLDGRVLVDVWETGVINSPSVQTWIPPLGFGDPMIEGIFVQSVVGEEGRFVGCCPADLPEGVSQQIVEQSWLLAFFFQQLGYVGRCSFDLILVGSDVSDCRVEFIESNARWGGTSGPMTLLHRLNLPPDRKYCVRKVAVPGLARLGFAKLLRRMGDDLYDPEAGKGNYVFFNPARVKEHSAIEVIAIADSDSEAQRLMSDLKKRLAHEVEHTLRKPRSISSFLMGHI